VVLVAAESLAIAAVGCGSLLTDEFEASGAGAAEVELAVGAAVVAGIGVVVVAGLGVADPDQLTESLSAAPPYPGPSAWAAGIATTATAAVRRGRAISTTRRTRGDGRQPWCPPAGRAGTRAFPCMARVSGSSSEPHLMSGGSWVYR
jgi:hypothetical protein